MPHPVHRRQLSKSRFTAGLQCPKLLWWRVHEPDAPELTPDPAQQALFDQGTRVGIVARDYVPGGVLIDLPHYAHRDRVEATKQAMATDVAAIYEAGVMGGGVFAAVDILERSEWGWRVVEVKSTTSVKEEHLPDLAVQVYAARSQGLAVVGAEVMHLNRECRHPDLSNLFIRKDRLEAVTELLPSMPDLVEGQLKVLDGALPDAPTGLHCQSPYPCPFLSRCWPEPPAHHISTLNGVGPQKTVKWEEKGVRTIFDLPQDARLNPVQARQRTAVCEDRMVVDPGLRQDLQAFDADAAFLDFETINPAIPVWPGCRPYDQVPVQVSVHRRQPGMAAVHHAFLAEGPADPREAVATAVIVACAGAHVVVAWNASFERSALKALAQALPHLAGELQAVIDRLVDPMVVVREHVCHKDFGGSFSLKAVLPVFAPELVYDDLTIKDGDTAARELERLILGTHSIAADDRARLRKDLLAYCERDTYGMMVVLDRLRALAEA